MNYYKITVMSDGDNYEWVVCARNKSDAINRFWDSDLSILLKKTSDIEIKVKSVEKQKEVA